MVVYNHSRLSKFVPIESPYAISYLLSFPRCNDLLIENLRAIAVFTDPSLV